MQNESATKKLSASNYFSDSHYIFSLCQVIHDRFFLFSVIFDSGRESSDCVEHGVIATAHGHLTSSKSPSFLKWPRIISQISSLPLSWTNRCIKWICKDEIMMLTAISSPGGPMTIAQRLFSAPQLSPFSFVMHKLKPNSDHRWSLQSVHRRIETDTVK